MKNKLLLLLYAAILSFVISCEHNDVFGGLEPNTDRIIAEFTDTKTGSYVSHDFSTQPVEIDLTELRLVTRSVTTGTTRVKVIVNQALVSAYNRANSTAYKPASATDLALLPNEYILNPEQRRVMVRAILRPSAFLDGQYAVGLSIAEMSNGEISNVAHTVIVFISIKNSYDGIYSVKGYSNIPGSSYTGNFSLACGEKLEVATSGDGSVYLSPAQPVHNGGSFSYISNLLPDFTFDKTTNKVNAVAARAGSLSFLFPYDVQYDSRYDPATKTIYIKYGIAPLGSGRYIIDTLRLCGPR